MRAGHALTAAPAVCGAGALEPRFPHLESKGAGDVGSHCGGVSDTDGAVGEARCTAVAGFIDTCRRAGGHRKWACPISAPPWLRLPASSRMELSIFFNSVFIYQSQMPLHYFFVWKQLSF